MEHPQLPIGTTPAVIQRDQHTRASCLSTRASQSHKRVASSHRRSRTFWLARQYQKNRPLGLRSPTSMYLAFALHRTVDRSSSINLRRKRQGYSKRRVKSGHVPAKGRSMLGVGCKGPACANLPHEGVCFWKPVSTRGNLPSQPTAVHAHVLLPSPPGKLTIPLLSSKRPHNMTALVLQQSAGHQNIAKLSSCSNSPCPVAVDTAHKAITMQCQVQVEQPVQHFLCKSMLLHVHNVVLLPADVAQCGHTTHAMSGFSCA